MKKMSPEDPKTINDPCSVSFIYSEQREAQEAEPDEAAINTRGAQKLPITPEEPPETSIRLAISTLTHKMTLTPKEPKTKDDRWRTTRMKLAK